MSEASRRVTKILLVTIGTLGSLKCGLDQIVNGRKAILISRSNENIHYDIGRTAEMSIC